MVKLNITLTMNVAIFLRTAFFIEELWWLLLNSNLLLATQIFTKTKRNYFYFRPLGRLYNPARRRNRVGRKNLTIFKGCHYSRLYMMISSSFRKIKTENLNSDPCILIFLVPGATSPAAYSLSKH